MKDFDTEEKKRLIKESQMASIITSPSKTLAAHVVVYRAINMNKDIAVACMKELMKRRNDGDDYDFEAYIEEELAKIPKPQNVDYVKIIKNMQKNFKKST